MEWKLRFKIFPLEHFFARLKAQTAELFLMSTSNPNPVFEQIEREAQNQSRFLKVQPGQSLVANFDANKIQLVDRQIEDRKSKAAQYTVVYEGQEKIITFSLSWALNLNELLKAGYTNIKVTRRGGGLDTSYNFVPI